MKKMIALALVLASSSAFAVVDTTDLTCAQARAYVQRNLITALSVNGGQYQTYYANAADAECGGNGVVQQAWAPTADAANCPVAYVCVSKDTLYGLSH